MIRTGDEYRESIRDGREVWIDGERVKDVTTHPAFKPIVDARARIYDIAHEDATRDVMTYVDAESGERCPIGSKLPLTKQDWHDKRMAVDTVFDDLGGIVTRVGDETVGEMWSLYDGQDVLNEIDPAFSEHIRHHVRHAALADPFHVSANTDPKGDRSKRPQDQDPDVLLHVVGETDNGIVVRGAKFETAAAYANQAFVKPTIGDWGDAKLSDYAVGLHRRHGRARHQAHLPLDLRGTGAATPTTRCPNRFDEVDTMIIFDDVEIPWENVLFYRHTQRGRIHPRDAPPLQRSSRSCSGTCASPTCCSGIAYTNAVQTGVKMHQGVREKLAELACYREGINAHLTAADRAGRDQPWRAAHAQPVAAVHRPGPGLLTAAGDDAPRARPVRRPALRHAQTRPSFDDSRDGT